MFCVVQYTNKSVAVVPKLWYKDGYTLWPTYTSDERIHRAVKFAEVPGQDWTKHPVRLLKSYDDFMSAWHGMKQSLTCDTSELDSDEEIEAGGRGKRPHKPIDIVILYTSTTHPASAILMFSISTTLPFRAPLLFCTSS
ncbi:hypothetical protein N1851_002950 [Merluccius polli]|uniref:Uncharacterized protein n=1 Tax=Merluccius polli TaxID=89951 RepID=A0AA47NA65_MERPO|nr:hypothetical protein N1851_002950 [Merluccius polli]